MRISLDEARICLDCDVVTDCDTCPACGRVQTFPLAVWLIPLEASQTRPWSGGLRIETGAAARWLARHAPSKAARLRPGAKARPATRPRWLIVVRADEQELYQFLRRRFQRMAGVEVVLDRRKRERRGSQRPLATKERRRSGRRAPLSPEERAWWQLAGFRIIGRAESFRLYEASATDADPRQPAGAQRGLIRSSSTSKTSVAPGGITRPAPRSP